MKEQAPGVRSDAINETSLRSVELRDFSTTWRVLPISVLALLIGVVAAYVAVALLKLIGFFTNLFFFQTLSTEFRSPAAAVWPLREVSIGHHLGWLAVFVPIIGGIIVGLMARFGSDKIRGHGIPEAIEAILLRGARVEPRVAVLKPISAAVAIGSGGPFGAEGPIIMTGGAFGSLIAQFFHLTNAERKTLLPACLRHSLRRSLLSCLR
jgi:H+/Cl- antiporter ClcA